MKNKDKIIEGLINVFTFITSVLVLFLIIFIIKEGFPLFKSVSLNDFLFNANWNPTSNNKEFGILTMVLGSVYISFLSIVFALPLGIGCSIYICFCLKNKTGKVILSFIDMLAGIPSVIFGFIGLVVIVKIFEKGFNMTSGESVLAGSMLLCIMILPFIITNCTESLFNGKKLYEASSLNLGVCTWYTLRKIILPYSIKAIGVSLILAFSRAMGETMAVMMVIGNSPVIPKLFNKAETIPSLIALEMGSVEYDSLHYHALYAAGLVLLLMLFVCNILFYLLKGMKRRRW